MIVFFWVCGFDLLFAVLILADCVDCLNTTLTDHWLMLRYVVCFLVSLVFYLFICCLLLFVGVSAMPFN